jgi:hypothetical protein
LPAILEQFIQDLHYAVRMIARNPAFTAMAALTLALGMGSNTAIYSLMDAILLRSMSVPRPEELAVVQYHTRIFRPSPTTSTAPISAIRGSD